jgi:hypothetical protein
VLVDSLATTASSLSPLDYYEASKFTIELLYNPFVPENITNWRLFEGGEHIIAFVTNEENFKNLAIDNEVFQGMLAEKEDSEHNMDKYSNTIVFTLFVTLVRK